MKTYHFENAPSLMWKDANGGLITVTEKVFLVVLVQLHEKRKRIKKFALSNENATVWTSENKAKMLDLVWRKYFAPISRGEDRLLIKTH